MSGWSRGGVGSPEPAQRWLWSSLRADWSGDAEHLFPPPPRRQFISINTLLCADRLRHIKRQPTPVEMAARHEILGPAALWWWRTLSSFPEATCPRWHFHVIATRFHHSAATLCTWSDVDAVKRSLVWISASVRLVCASPTRSSDWGRYCAVASCWFKYVGPPLGLCFRFPLPAHDCLTMGGNQS